MDEKTQFDTLSRLQDELGRARFDYWLQHSLFTFDWWMLLLFFSITWILWWRLVLLFILEPFMIKVGV